MSEHEAVAPEEEATQEAVAEEVTQEDQHEEGQEAKAETPEGTEDRDGPKSRHQRRKEAMERMRADMLAAEQRAREAEERLREFNEMAGQSAMPKQEDYQSYEEFQAALSAHHAMRAMDDRQKSQIQRDMEARRAEVERAKQQEQAEIAQGWQSQVSEAKQRYSDFEQVAFTAPISQPVAEIVAQMDGGADVAYHLGLNHAEAQRLSNMSPVHAAMELARIEARLQAPAPRTVTNAPEPVKPVRSKASAGKDPEKMSMAEYRKWRAGQK